MGDSQSYCTRCAARNRTCCRDTDVFITCGDVERISACVGRRDFLEFRPPMDPRYLEQDDDPLWREAVFQPDGTRRVVKRRAGGDCEFLTPSGCFLPREVRPLICRLYPWQFDERGMHKGLAEDCPASCLGSFQRLGELFDVDIERVRVWHAQLYRELRLEKQAPCTLA